MLIFSRREIIETPWENFTSFVCFYKVNLLEAEESNDVVDMSDSVLHMLHFYSIHSFEFRYIEFVLSIKALIIAIVQCLWIHKFCSSKSL